MTEEEAREKWCPFVRVAVEFNQYVGSANRGLAKDEDPHSTCIASACMAWRWRIGQSGHPVAVVSYGKHIPVGFCGLAGAPQ